MAAYARRTLARTCSNRPKVASLASTVAFLVAPPVANRRGPHGSVTIVTAAPSHFDGSGPATPTLRPDPMSDDESGLPIQRLQDWLLVRVDVSEGYRRTAAGIVIPATAAVGHRLAWATTVGIGPHVRA